MKQEEGFIGCATLFYKLFPQRFVLAPEIITGRAIVSKLPEVKCDALQSLTKKIGIHLSVSHVTCPSAGA